MFFDDDFFDAAALALTSARVLEVGPSDHYPILARFQRVSSRAP